MGAIASVAQAIEIVRNRGVLEQGRRWAEFFAAEATAQEAELRRRQETYRAQLPPLSVAGRVVVVVDDGMATGATMRAAAAAVRRAGPKRLVVAVPVGLPDSFEGLPELADEVVCAWTPTSFRAVGQAYRIFDQTTDEEVRRILAGPRNRDRE